jgi:23S rRNA pseudouridine2604 synthase
MKHGVDIGVVGKTRHYKTKPIKIRKVADRKVEIVLTEGKNRQIRRMCGALGFKVIKLKRFRIGSVHLGHLKKGSYRALKKTEVDALLSI